MTQIIPPALKIGLLSFWTLWLTAVFITNVFEALKTWGLLPKDWPWASGNYAMIKSAVPLPTWTTKLLFLGVVLWQATGVVLFWVALYRFTTAGSEALAEVSAAFGTTLGLWAAFMISDEIFRIYQYQTTHLLLFVSQLLSLLAIVLLP
jgi:hypothetical protein